MGNFLLLFISISLAVVGQLCMKQGMMVFGKFPVTEMLGKLIGIENRTWVRVAGFNKVYAIADEDLERERADKTSSVHFLRFELAPDMIAALKLGADLGMGVEHPQYEVAIAEIDPVSREALVADLR